MCRKRPEALFRYVISPEISAALSTNQITNQNRLRLGLPRFPALWAVSV